MSGFVVDDSSIGAVNYRQVGKIGAGKIKHAGDAFEYQPVPSSTTMKLRMKRTTPSIPTKFDTQINVGQRERNAFGTRINRFSGHNTEVPGPGNYYKPEAESGESRTSISKLGFGVGFVSKADRFSEKPMRESAVAPAPGQYLSAALPSVMSQRIHSVAPTTSAFVPPKKWRDDPTLPLSATPGPGQYDAVISPVRLSSKTTTFGTAKLRPASTSAIPPPGAYELPSSLKITPGTSSMFQSSVPRLAVSSVSNSGTRSLLSTAQFLQTATAANLKTRHPEDDALGAAATVLGITKSDARGLGPGSYDASLVPAKIDMGTSTSLFGSAGHLDRWGRPVIKRTTTQVPVPGPGSYSLPESAPITASVSAFKSSTTRGFVLPSEAPGPAFYKPSPVEKRSHVLNPENKWL